MVGIMKENCPFQRLMCFRYSVPIICDEENCDCICNEEINDNES